MELDHLLEKPDLALDHVQEALSRYGLLTEADEIDGVPGVQCVADLALCLETADTRAFSGPRIHDYHRSLVGSMTTPSGGRIRDSE
jgi:hypothetical protein